MAEVAVTGLVAAIGDVGVMTVGIEAMESRTGQIVVVSYDDEKWIWEMSDPW